MGLLCLLVREKCFLYGESTILEWQLPRENVLLDRADSKLKLWHCLFDQETGAVTYRFYLGDEMTNDGRLEACRSDYLTFTFEDEPPRHS